MVKKNMALCVPGLLVLSLMGCSSNDSNTSSSATKAKTTATKSTALSSEQIKANNEKIYGSKVNTDEFDTLVSGMSVNDKNPRTTKVFGNVDKSDGYTDETMDGGSYQIWAGCSKGTIKVTHNRKVIADGIKCDGRIKNVVDNICVVKGSNNFMVETSTKTAFALGSIKKRDTCAK